MLHVVHVEGDEGRLDRLLDVRVGEYGLFDEGTKLVLRNFCGKWSNLFSNALVEFGSHRLSGIRHLMDKAVNTVDNLVKDILSESCSS